MYTERFVLADDYISHLDDMMAGIADPFIQSRYLGFVAISAVTVYELAIKDIFYNFAEQKHSVLGNMTRAKFEQINGRIKISSLTKEHIRPFGAKYEKRFNRKLEEKEKESLLSGNGSIKAAYGNIISWRHVFVHSGVAPSTTTYQEVKRAYQTGTGVLHTLNETMYR